MRILVVILLVACVVSLEARRHHKHGRVELKPREDAVDEGSVPVKDGEGGGRQAAKHRGHAKKHHPVGASTDTVYKDEWKRITDYHKTDPEACQALRCRRRQVCLINAETSQAECVHKRLLRLRRKMKKGQGKADQKGENSKEEKRRRFPSERMKNRKLPPTSARGRTPNTLFKRQSKVAFDYLDRSASKKAELNIRHQNSVLTQKPKKECTQRDLNEMGRRLLDWFKLLQEEDERERRMKNAHHKMKRNSKKRELRDDDECVCQAPVSWEFDQLDVDLDGQLSALELQDIEDNGYEHCVRPFINVCDHDHDLQLSEKEWCCCFADVLPPCLGAQRKVPTQKVEGHTKVLTGAFVPECDSDGFYKRQQCHGSTGECWCVDRNGHEIPKTRMKGGTDCGEDSETSTQDDV